LSRNHALLQEIFDLLIYAPFTCRILEPYDNPFWDFNNGGKNKKKEKTNYLKFPLYPLRACWLGLSLPQLLQCFASHLQCCAVHLDLELRLTLAKSKCYVVIWSQSSHLVTILSRLLIKNFVIKFPLVSM
jgi:hypothetical protein